MGRVEKAKRERELTPTEVFAALTDEQFVELIRHAAGKKIVEEFRGTKIPTGHDKSIAEILRTVEPMISPDATFSSVWLEKYIEPREERSSRAL